VNSFVNCIWDIVMHVEAPDGPCEVQDLHIKKGVGKAEEVSLVSESLGRKFGGEEGGVCSVYDFTT
jgi:hypothetical protein